MANYLFTSESVALGHPDKVADYISDSILDAALTQDKDSKVACETLVTHGLVILAGEITTKAHLDYQQITRDAIKEIGYSSDVLGFNGNSCACLVTIHKQSSDIAQGVNEGEGLYKEQGAGDQGLMFGYACNETKELMPLPIAIAHRIIKELQTLRQRNTLSYLRPDAKTQVTIEYSEDNTPLRLHTVVISTQHIEDIDHHTLSNDMKALVKRVVDPKLIDENTKYFINPTGRFVIGGPAGDTGLTGRKIIVDTYGGMGRHGGGAFSGKDPSKVDRSAAYAARYIAKNIVAASLATRCEVQLSYAIGVAKPISIKIDTFGTSKVEEDVLSKAVHKLFDLSPKGMIEMLNLKRPIYRKTASLGHFGREDEDFTWEKTDRVQDLLKACQGYCAFSK